MDSAVKQTLMDHGFYFTHPSFCKAKKGSAVLENAEAVAICRKGCDKKRTGLFAIPIGAVANDKAVRDAVRHSGCCAAAQRMKQHRREQEFTPKARYVPKCRYSRALMLDVVDDIMRDRKLRLLSNKEQYKEFRNRCGEGTMAQFVKRKYLWLKYYGSFLPKPPPRTRLTENGRIKTDVSPPT